MGTYENVIKIVDMKRCNATLLIYSIALAQPFGGFAQ